MNFWLMITTRELLNATDMAIEMKQKGVLGNRYVKVPTVSVISSQCHPA